MNYFFVTTLIFILLFLITLIFLILSLKKSASRTSKLEHDKNGLKEKVLRLEDIRDEQKKILEMALDAVPDGIVVLDRDLRAVNINQAIINLFHLDRPKTIGQKTIFIFNNRNIEMLVEDAISSGMPRKKDIVFYGDEEISLSIDAIPAELETYSLIMVFNNITQEVEFSRLRSQFVANVSHEMRTPLTSIKGYIETLIGSAGTAGSKNDTENISKYLSKALLEAERLNLLIEDILNLSNIEYRRNILFKQKLDIVELINECIGSLSLLAEKNNVNIEFIHKKEHCMLQTEEALFMQVVRNLVENAIFHGGNGTTLKIMIEENEGETILSFEDNGRGIDSLDLPYIFQRFYRGKAGYKNFRSGSGLGLSIVKHIVELHGGTIEVSSQPGKQTKFVLTFPN